MLNFSFIEATENMCLELAHVKKQVWLTTYKGIYSDSKIEDFDYSEHEKKFKKYINSQDLKLYVAVLEKKIIGYTAVGKSPHRKEKQIEIVLLYLLKEFQCKGFGKIMFEFAKTKLSKRAQNNFLFRATSSITMHKSFMKKWVEKLFILMKTTRINLCHK